MSFDPRISEWGNPPSTIRIPRLARKGSGLGNKTPVLDYELSNEGI
jgi:hypothetical protein